MGLNLPGALVKICHQIIKLRWSFTQKIVAGLFLSQVAQAHPQYKFAYEFPSLLQKPRSSIIVIFNAGTSDKPDFRLALPAIVPVTRDGKIRWFENEAWKSEPFNGTDRVVIEKDMFGSDVKSSYSFTGCSPRGGEKFLTDQGVAWLASCNPEVIAKIDSKVRRVVYDPVGGQILSRFYSYKFKKDNHMLFDEVKLKGASEFLISKDSHLYIRSDVKNFFTLNFSSADIESDLKQRRVDPIAAFASLGFYLKVLFFKLTLDLTTDVAFYESSANIPMVMTLPVNAYDRLHRKSGVLYNFRLGESVDPKSIKVNMPLLNSDELKGNFEKLGLKYCSDICRYEIEVTNPVKTVHMKINIARNLVEKGMFPWFVDDLAKHRDAMRWTLDDYKGRVGLYFEVSKLPKGSHPWDLWLTF